jgi:hypothetical protein
MRHALTTEIATLLISFLAFGAAAGATQETGTGDRRTASEPSTADAIHALIHAGKISEMMAKVDAVGADNPDWKRIMELLMEVAERDNDYSYLKRKAKEELAASKDPETRATSAFALGMGCWRSGELRQAEAAFAVVGKILPDSELAQAAAGNAHEIKFLGVGQPAPRFTVHTTAGAPLSSEDLKGRVVLLNFWASW